MAHEYFFYIAGEDIAFDGELAHSFTVCGDEHHHLSRVLRLRPGDRIAATDGFGLCLEGRITAIGAKETTVAVELQARNRGEAPLRLVLAQGVPKAPRFEWLLEKGTEAGIHSFWPMLSSHSTAKPEKSSHKAQRWQRLAIAAMKQCGRSVLPEVAAPQSFAEVLGRAGEFDQCWIAHHPAPPGASIWHPSSGRIASRGLLLVGPEGGFSDAEVEQACAAGCQVLQLGSRRLRSETAGLLAASLLLLDSEFRFTLPAATENP